MAKAKLLFSLVAVTAAKIFANRISVFIAIFHLPTTLLSFPGYVLPRVSLVQSHKLKSSNHF